MGLNTVYHSVFAYSSMFVVLKSLTLQSCKYCYISFHCAHDFFFLPFTKDRNLQKQLPKRKCKYRLLYINQDSPRHYTYVDNG